MIGELLIKYDFLKIGRKLELWGTLVTTLGVISITTGILSRMIFTPIIPIYPDYIRIFVILGSSLIISGGIINYLTLRWMKKETQKTQNNLIKTKKTQEWEEFQKTSKDYIEHFGYQLQKGGISFASLGILTFAYAWVAVHNILKIYSSYNVYSNYDVFISLIIVTACLATAAVLLIYGDYWKNRAKKTEPT
nr:hypothetical protein [Candidatus Freyarchaeota archaeon]